MAATHITLLTSMAVLAAPSAVAQWTSYDQFYDGTSSAVRSQAFSDQPAQSAYGMDSFLVPPGVVWAPTKIRVYGVETGDASHTTAAHLRLLFDPISAPCLVLG